MRRASAAIVAATACFLVACASTPLPMEVDEERAGDFLTVTGALTYGERIALVPGSVMRLSLSEVSQDGTPAALLAEQIVVLDGAQVPVPFALSVDMQLLRPGGRYALGGAIEGAAGGPGWATDAVHAVDLQSVTNDLGVLDLVRVGPRTASVAYLCGDTALRVRFAEERVFLTLDGTVYELPRTISGSGARFALKDEGGPMVFWDRGDAAIFAQGTAARPCRRDG
jgi:putative lipoprotein